MAPSVRSGWAGVGKSAEDVEKAFFVSLLPSMSAIATKSVPFVHAGYAAASTTNTWRCDVLFLSFV